MGYTTILSNRVIFSLGSKDGEDFEKDRETLSR